MTHFVDIELQILTTDRDNIPQLMCTKSRRTKNIVRKGWRRDFFYDEDSLIITPIHEDDANKQEVVERMLEAKEELKLSNYQIADGIGASERTVRRYLSGTLPPIIKIPTIIAWLASLNLDASPKRHESVAKASPLASSDDKKVTHEASVTHEPIYIENKNISNKE